MSFGTDPGCKKNFENRFRMLLVWGTGLKNFFYVFCIFRFFRKKNFLFILSFGTDPSCKKNFENRFRMLLVWGTGLKNFFYVFCIFRFFRKKNFLFILSFGTDLGCKKNFGGQNAYNVENSDQKKCF